MIGEGGRPEAVVVPFEEYLRMARHDLGEEKTFRDEVDRRVRGPWTDTPCETVEDFASSLGPAGRAWVAGRRSDRPNRTDATGETDD